MRIHHHHGAGNFRHLAQPILSLRLQWRDVDHVAGREHLADFLNWLRRTTRRFRPFDALEGYEADFAILDDSAPRVARRLQPDASGLIVDLEHDSEPPRNDVVQELDLGKFDAPIAPSIDGGDRAAITLTFVEIDETINYRPARQHLQLRIERGAHRQPALIEFFLAVFLIKIPPHFLGEIFGCENVRAGRPNGDLQRILLGFFGLGGGDVAVLRHAVDHVIAAIDGGIVPAERVVIVRPLRQSGKISGFGNRQLVHRFVEIQQRCRRYAIGTVAEINLVKIEFEDLLLRIGAFDTQRQQRFLDLALKRQFVAQKKILRDLLRNGGGALRTAAASVIFDIKHAGAADAVYIDAGVLIEILVLGGDESIGDKFRDRLNRQIKPALLGVFRK